ncbi:bifunctional metallophosphatase/5'-nucleotidase [Novosphingobium sp.]|uniref:bifunctional metallophosphatase/5'-nucleotidase n=1 Tax=Novosphingobium sp. TaxID=1874826 RepID=UPI0025DBE122|nr:bifunctional metallophosphatase/5'-nucleotidase [Novosphingobium sp.]MCC6926750.1 bifunctional metallophosphatase/5'-nucleotidase [Novosphingobium sp.]
MLIHPRLSLLAPLALLGACSGQHVQSASAQSPQTVTVGIAALNDFHGALEPPKTSVIVGDGKGGVLQLPAGGSAYLASAVDSIRGQYPNHLTVAAGDLIGATQLSSSLFLDEPAIGVMNRLGLDFNAVGNHEFDRGRDELIRKQLGGCRQYTQLKPCRIEQFSGARFAFLAANSIEPDGKTLFAPSAIRTFGKGKRRVKVGLIGITLKETADLSSREGLQGIRFADEADTVNALVPKLKAQGADAIVLLIHQGGYTKGDVPDPGACPNLTGAIRPILDRLDTRVDVVISGHTHWSYVCDYAQYNPAKPFLLTSAGVFGQSVTDLTLEIDPAADKVVAKRARNVVVQSVGYDTRIGRIEPKPAYPVFAPRADIAAYVGKYGEAAKVEIQRPAGKLAGEVARPGGDSSGTGGTLGYVIADAQLAATRKAGAQIAFMNPFGIRSPHILAPAADGTLTFGQIYAVQPFNNGLVTQSLTGAELKAVLEEGLDDTQPKQVLSGSAGFLFSYDLTRPAGDRVVAMTLDGKPIDPAATYRVTTNSFLANGGDSFASLAKQRDAAIAQLSDIEALEAWLSGGEPRAVPIGERAIQIKR